MSGKGTSARLGLSRLISGITSAVVLVIVLGILLIVLDANPANDLVSLVTDVGEALVGPFERLFTLDDRDARVAVNWGVAALVYAVVGRFLARLAAP